MVIFLKHVAKTCFWRLCVTNLSAQSTSICGFHSAEFEQTVNESEARKTPETNKQILMELPVYHDRRNTQRHHTIRSY